MGKAEKTNLIINNIGSDTIFWGNWYIWIASKNSASYATIFWENILKIFHSDHDPFGGNVETREKNIFFPKFLY